MVKSPSIIGSYAPGEARKSSDLDLLVEIDDPKMGLLRFMALENYLSDLLGVKVDLVEKQALKPAIGRHVTEEMKAYEGLPPGVILNRYPDSFPSQAVGWPQDRDDRRQQSDRKAGQECLMHPRLKDI